MPATICESSTFLNPLVGLRKHPGRRSYTPTGSKLCEETNRNDIVFEFENTSAYSFSLSKAYTSHFELTALFRRPGRHISIASDAQRTIRSGHRVRFQTAHDGNNVGESTTTSRVDAPDDEDYRSERDFVPIFFNTLRRTTTTQRRSMANTTIERPYTRAGLTARDIDDHTTATTHQIIDLGGEGEAEPRSHETEDHPAERVQQRDDNDSDWELTSSSWTLGRGSTSVDIESTVESVNRPQNVMPGPPMQNGMRATQQLRSLESVHTIDLLAEQLRCTPLLARRSVLHNVQPVDLHRAAVTRMQDAADASQREDADTDDTEDFQLRRDLADIERNHQIELANIRAMERAQLKQKRRQLSRDL